MDIITTTSETNPNEANNSIAGSGLFKIVDKTVKINLFGSQTYECTYPQAVATNPIDILKNFSWCNSTTDISEVPSIYATEYELSWGQTMTNLQRFALGATQIMNKKMDDPYLILYSARPTGFNYRFPHLLGNGSNLRDISNSWGAENNDFMSEITGLLSKKTKDFIGGIAGSLKTVGSIAGNILPGVGIEEIQKYTNTQCQTLDISFPLYNTKTTKQAFQNYCFCLLFAFQNLKTRTTFMTYIPPKLYKIHNAYNGGINMPVAIVENFSIESIGTTRVLKDFSIDGLTNSPIVIPEAYKITIRFKELIPQSSNIMLGVMGGKSVNVINDSATTDISNGINNITNLISNII